MSWLDRRLAPKELGRLGERRAMWFYRLRGYRIVARNLRLKSGELDLVVRRGRTVVVAEVKTRQTQTAGEGHEAVDGKKRTRLIRIADEYLAKHPEVRELRYDIVSLFWTGWRFVVSHYPDAFRADSDPVRPWILRG